MKMNLKKIVTITTAVFLISGSVYAMYPGPYGEPRMGPPPVEQLQDQLDLSDTQIEELRTLFAEKRKQHRALRQERRIQREQLQKKLSGILTPTQLEDFKAMRGCDRKQGKRFNGHGMQRNFW